MTARHINHKFPQLFSLNLHLETALHPFNCDLGGPDISLRIKAVG